jgi:hypothetical protein
MKRMSKTMIALLLKVQSYDKAYVYTKREINAAYNLQTLNLVKVEKLDDLYFKVMPVYEFELLESIFG